MKADDLERLVQAGLITAGEADSARRVDDDIASTAIGKLVCIGSDAKVLLPGYARAFGLTAASDEALARSKRPELPDGVIDGLAALPAAPSYGADGVVEIIVASADAAARLVELALPPHRVLVADEPRLMALLDRVLGGDAGPAAAPVAAPFSVEPPFSEEPAPLETADPPAKSQRFLARPVREVDRREKRDPNAGVVIVPPQPLARRETPPARETSAPSAPVPPKPEPARGLPRAAIAVVVVVVVVAGAFVARMALTPEVPVVVDARVAALAEGRAKERAGESAWALSAYTRVVEDPRRDDATAEAILGRARANVALGDREAALSDIALVVDGTFASAALKAQGEQLRATLH